MKVAVLVEKKYQVLEVWYPYYRLKEAGIDTVLVGTSEATFGSKEGYPAAAEMAISEANANDFDGVIVPGGYAPDYLRRSGEMIAFVSQLFKADKLVAAICHGPWLLASAHVLEGKKATSFYAIKDDVVNAGADYMDREVVTDKNLITSRTPDDLPAFCQAILEFLH